MGRVSANTSSFTLPFVQIVVLVAIAPPVGELFALARLGVVVPPHEHGATDTGSLW